MNNTVINTECLVTNPLITVNNQVIIKLYFSVLGLNGRFPTKKRILDDICLIVGHNLNSQGYKETICAALYIGSLAKLIVDYPDQLKYIRIK